MIQGVRLSLRDQRFLHQGAFSTYAVPSVVCFTKGRMVPCARHFMAPRTRSHILPSLCGAECQDFALKCYSYPFKLESADATVESPLRVMIDPSSKHITISYSVHDGSTVLWEIQMCSIMIHAQG
jgi:hypothetical protein